MRFFQVFRMLLSESMINKFRRRYNISITCNGSNHQAQMRFSQTYLFYLFRDKKGVLDLVAVVHFYTDVSGDRKNVGANLAKW